MKPFFFERIQWHKQFEALDGIVEHVLTYRAPARTKKSKKRQRQRRKVAKARAS